jgi:hypothetical protein
MEKMKPPTKNHIRSFVCWLLVSTMLMACSFLSLSDSSSHPSSAPEQETPGDEAASVENEPDPLDRLLSMRSIKINLTALRPDGTKRTIDVEIDSAENMRVKYNLPAMDPKILPEGVDPTELPTSYEMYVVDGNAYEPSDLDPAWMTTPYGKDFGKTLSDQMHGMDGPALWLDILPEGSIRAAGNETVGGFAADKYAVNGTIDGQRITGTLWFEPQADALVQAELHVPATLLGDPSISQQGELKISLNAQKADIPTVTMPDAPAGPIGGTATPNSK